MVSLCVQFSYRNASRALFSEGMTRPIRTLLRLLRPALRAREEVVNTYKADKFEARAKSFVSLDCEARLLIYPFFTNFRKGIPTSTSALEKDRFHPFLYSVGSPDGPRFFVSDVNCGKAQPRLTNEPQLLVREVLAVCKLSAMDHVLSIFSELFGLFLLGPGRDKFIPIR